METIVITQDMLDADPTLAKAGYQVGDPLPEAPEPINPPVGNQTPPSDVASEVPVGEPSDRGPFKFYKVMVSDLEIYGQLLPKEIAIALIDAEAEPLLANRSIEVLHLKAKEATHDDTHASVWKDGILIRTYSLEVHGEKFGQLAEQFAANEGGSTTPPGSV